MSDLQARAEAAADATGHIRGMGFWAVAHKAALHALQSEGWRPLETAPYGERVEVRAGSMTFLAELHRGVSEDEDGNACDQWAAVVEGEHPPCWTDGGCWASNANEIQSMQPTAWRPAPSEGDGV